MTTIEHLVNRVIKFTVFAVWQGNAVLATHQVFVRIQAIVTMIFFGFGLVSMAIVNTNPGALNIFQANRTGKVTGLAGVPAAIFIAGFLYLVFITIVPIFSGEEPA